MDITNHQMLLTCKLSALAWCYSDGDKIPEKLTKGKLKFFKKLDQKKYAIQELPNILEVMSYAFFFPACLVGPFYEYKDFIDFINRRGEFTHIPSTFKASTIRLSHALSIILLLNRSVCSAWNIILSMFFNPQHCLTEEFAKTSILWKVKK